MDGCFFGAGRPTVDADLLGHHVAVVLSVDASGRGIDEAAGTTAAHLAILALGIPLLDRLGRIDVRNLLRDALFEGLTPLHLGSRVAEPLGRGPVLGRGVALVEDVRDAAVANNIFISTPAEVWARFQEWWPAGLQRDLLPSLINVAVGFAALGFAVSFEEPDALLPMLGCAAFPGFIGLAFILMAFVARGRK